MEENKVPENTTVISSNVFLQLMKDSLTLEAIKRYVRLREKKGYCIETEMIEVICGESFTDDEEEADTEKPAEE